MIEALCLLAVIGALAMYLIKRGATEKPPGKMGAERMTEDDAWSHIRKRRGECTDASLEDDSPLRLSVSISSRTVDYDKPLFDGNAYPQFRIEYADVDGVVSVRDIYVHEVREQASFYLLDSWCFMRSDRRRFRSDRIMSARNLRTGRAIKNLPEYIRKNGGSFFVRR